MNERLTVEIDAQVSKFDKALKDVERNIDRVTKEIKEATVISRGYEKAQSDLAREFKQGTITQSQYRKGLERLQRDEKESNVVIKNLKTELRGLNAAQKDLGGTTQKTTGAVGKLGKTTSANALPAMTSFSQVIQDAPYGIQGVANNIQQLTMQMGYLSRGAGGAGGALKAMVSSMIGPAGILLAISAITTAMISYGDEMLDFIKNTSDAEKAQRRLAEAMASGIAEARTSALELSALTDEIKNNNGSILNQTKAYNKLNDVAPELTEIYTLQEIAAGKADTAIQKLTESLLQQAAIEGAKEVITELNEEMFKLESNLGEGTASFWDWLEAAKQTAGMTLVPGDYSTFRELLEMRGAATGQEEIDKLDKQLEKFTKRYRELISESMNPSQDGDFFDINSAEARKAAIEQQKVLDKIAEEANKGGKGKALRIPIEPILDMGAGGLLGDSAGFAGELEFKAKLDADLTLLKEAQSLFSPLSDEFEFLGTQIEFIENRLKGFQSELTNSGITAAEELSKMADVSTDKMAETAERQNQIVQSIGLALASTISEMSSSLIDGEADVEEFAKGFLKTVGKIVSGFLAQAIAGAIAGGTNAAVATGPAAPFTISGLIASTIGAVTGAKSQIPSFKDGTASMVGDKNLAMVNRGEMILNSRQQRNMFNSLNTPSVSPSDNTLQVEVIGQIDGDTIRLSMDRNDRRRGRIG